MWRVYERVLFTHKKKIKKQQQQQQHQQQKQKQKRTKKNKQKQLKIISNNLNNHSSIKLAKHYKLQS